MICLVCLALCQQHPASYTHRRVGFDLTCSACTSSCLHLGGRLICLSICSAAATAVSSSTCQTCRLSLDAVARSSGSTPKRCWASGRRSSGFIIPRLFMIRCMVFSYSNTDSAPGCRLKCSLSFLQVHWLCVI